MRKIFVVIFLVLSVVSWAQDEGYAYIMPMKADISASASSGDFSFEWTPSAEFIKKLSHYRFTTTVLQVFTMTELQARVARGEPWFFRIPAGLHNIEYFNGKDWDLSRGMYNFTAGEYYIVGLTMMNGTVTANVSLQPR